MKNSTLFRKKSILTFCVFVLLSLRIVAQTSWTTVAALPEYKWRLTGFSIGTKGYIVGGFLETASTFTGTNPTSKLWIYDSQTNTWSVGTNFPGGNTQKAFAFVIGGIAYVGSYEGTGFYAYDPNTDSWTAKTSRPSGSGFFYPVTFVIGGEGYVGLGQGTNIYKYNPTSNTWSTVTNPGIPTRWGSFAFAINNKAYIGGGIVSGSPSNTFYEFDPIGGTYSAKANYPSTTTYAQGFAINSTGLVASGYPGYTNHHSYNPGTNSWTTLTSLTQPTQEAGGFLINGDIYIVGGTTGSSAIATTQKGATGIITLPLKWESFSASLYNNSDVKLEWKTALEINNSSFTVEYSVNGIQYDKITEMPGKNNSSNEYMFVHTNATAGKNFYRIKQTDIDGKFSYSPVRIVTIGSKGIVKTYPNPVTDQLTVYLGEAGITKGSISISSLNGQQLFRKNLEGESNTVIISTTSWKDGIYILKITSENGVVQYQEKIVKK